MIEYRKTYIKVYLKFPKEKIKMYLCAYKLFCKCIYQSCNIEEVLFDDVFNLMGCHYKTKHQKIFYS